MIDLRTGLVIGSYVMVAALGAVANGWYHDSIELAEVNAVRAAIEASEQREDRIADSVEAKLSSLRANERTRTIRIPEIIKQPELVRVCLSEDAINTINDAVNGLYDSTAAE